MIVLLALLAYYRLERDVKVRASCCNYYLDGTGICNRYTLTNAFKFPNIENTNTRCYDFDISLPNPTPFPTWKPQRTPLRTNLAPPPTLRCNTVKHKSDPFKFIGFAITNLLE